MADYTDAEFSSLLDQLAQLPVEDRASDLLKLLKTLLTKNVTVQDWNTLIRDIAPLYATMLGLNDCMVNLINKVQRELGIVKDAIIGTNVGAETAESIPLLSGYVIHIGNGKAYGIVYDKVAQSVKLGLVEKTAEGNYRFQNGEGQAVALRADTNDLVTGRLVVWNGNKNRLETKFQVAQDATRMTIVQRNTDGEVITADPRSDNAAVPKSWLEGRYSTSLEITGQLQLISDALTQAKNEIDAELGKLSIEAVNETIPQRTTYGAVQTTDPRVSTDSVNLRYADKHYVAKIKKETQAGTILYGRDFNGNEKGFIVESIAHNANSIVQRKSGGAVEVGNPAAPKDAVNLEYLAAQLGAVTGASPYFMHNICITQTVDNVVNTVRVSLVCTQVAKITSVAALHTLIVQLNGGVDSAEGSVPVWHGACNMPPYNWSESIPDSMLVYSGSIGLWNDATLRAWGDTVYPYAGYGVTLDDTDWTVSDSVLNTVVGGTTA